MSTATAVCLFVKFKQTKTRPNQLCSFSCMSGNLFLHLPLRIANVPTQVVGGGLTFIKKVVVSPTPFALPNLFLWGVHLRVCWKPSHQLTIPVDNKPKQRGNIEPCFCQVWQVGNTPTQDSTPISHEAEKVR